MYTAPAGYSFTYAAVNNATGKIIATSPIANFMTLSQDQYTIKGISYISSITDPTVFIGKDFTEMRTSGYCFHESINARELTITSALGTAESTENSGIKIAPNPVTDLLKVRTDKKITDYAIYDMSGKQLRKNKFNKEISFKELIKGACILVLYENNSLTYKRTIIKK